VENEALAEKFAELSTPIVTDAALRLKPSARIAPSGIAPLLAGTRAAGRVLPARHFGNVDVSLHRHLRKLGGAIEQ
jgi:4-hydroxy-4-methyl-2-oxoglutarate aldolase